MPIPLFSPQPYIPQDNRLVTIEDSTLADNHVAFVLATNITLPADQKKLKDIKTVVLESMSFQCIIVVSNFSFLNP